MHTRRVGAFLIGAWLLGTLLMAFVTSQTLMTVDRILASPPQAVLKEFDDMGPDITRQILRFEASHVNRHLTEAWEIMQMGLGGALLATSLLTAHRSRVVIICSALMIAIVMYLYFLLTPMMNQAARSYDFLPATAATAERESHASYAVTYKVLDILKVLLGVVITGRLLFDRYDFSAKLLGGPSSSSRRSHGPGHIRRRRKSSSSYVYTGSSTPASDPVAIEKVDPVDNADDGHVDR